MAELRIFGCKVANCENPRGGPCYEGLKPEECPNRFQLEDAPGAQAVTAATPALTVSIPAKAAPAAEDITFSSGFPMLLREARVITEQHDARLVVVMGEKDAGKTTLLAELHHQFLTAPYAGFLFAGSRTLVGFEEKCFYSRIESGGEEDDTERTKHMDVRVLHLALRDEQRRGPATHLLFADVSGERFRQIRGSREEAGEFAPLLKRADRIALLVDGERLADVKTRQMSSTQPKTLIRGLLEAGALDGHSFIDVVFAKWDAVLAAKAEDVAGQLEGILKRDHAPRLGQMHFHRVSSRRKHDVPIEEGLGLDGLLRAWTAKKALRPAQTRTPAVFSERSFFRFSNLKAESND